MAQRAYDNFIGQFDEDGCIVSDRDMKITEINVKAGAIVSEGDSLFSYSSVGDELTFRFTCENALDNFVRIGTSLDIRLSIETDDGEFRLAKGVAIITQKKESEDGFECNAKLGEVDLFGSDQKPSYGDSVMINTEFESQPYKHIVMKSAIQNGGYIYAVVKTADEKRYVNQVPVTIVDESDFYVAVEMSSENLPIVLTATKELTDGQRVIVDG
jgi:phosphohistidine swiveling domain-containing protein